MEKDSDDDIEEVSMVSTAVSALTFAEPPVNRHRSKRLCSVTRKGFLLGVGFMVVIAMLVAIVCRQEHSFGGGSREDLVANAEPSTNVEETVLRAIEEKLEAHIRDNLEHISKLEAEIKEMRGKVHKTTGALHNQVHVILLALLFLLTLVSHTDIRVEITKRSTRRPCSKVNVAK